MNQIWLTLTAASGLYALVSGGGAAAAEALLGTAEEAVRLALTLAGTMALWSGLIEILSACGDVTRLGHGLRRLLRPLFAGVEDEESWAAMSLNLAANMAGLGNAATPAGMRAAGLLAAQGETGLRALAMLLVLNNSSLQLLPTSVISLRAAAGAANPADIWPAALLSSLAATITAAGLMRLCGKGGGTC